MHMNTYWHEEVDDIGIFKIVLAPAVAIASAGSSHRHTEKHTSVYVR